MELNKDEFKELVIIALEDTLGELSRSEYLSFELKLILAFHNKEQNYSKILTKMSDNTRDDYVAPCTLHNL